MITPSWKNERLLIKIFADFSKIKFISRCMHFSRQIKEKKKKHGALYKERRQTQLWSPLSSQSQTIRDPVIHSFHNVQLTNPKKKISPRLLLWNWSYINTVIKPLSWSRVFPLYVSEIRWWPVLLAWLDEVGMVQHRTILVTIQLRTSRGRTF